MIQQIVIPASGSIKIPVPFNGRCLVKLIKIDVVRPRAAGNPAMWTLRSDLNFFAGILGSMFYFCTGTIDDKIDNLYSDSIQFIADIGQWIDMKVTLPNGNGYNTVAPIIPDGGTPIIVTMDITPQY